MLLDKKTTEQIPPLYSREHEHDPEAVISLVDTVSGWRWYILEFDGKDTCFGLVKGQETELGYFSLVEIEGLNSRFERIVRDAAYAPTRLSLLMEART